jgi:hypothetical protein
MNAISARPSLCPTNSNSGRDGKTLVILVTGTGTYGGEVFVHDFADLLKPSSFGDPFHLTPHPQLNVRSLPGERPG